MSNVLYKDERRSGRTQFMIDHLIDAVRKGQPLCRVIGANYHQTVILRDRVLDEFRKTDLPWDARFSKKILSRNSLIIFHSSHRFLYEYRGMERYDCCFWDHYAIEYNPQVYKEWLKLISWRTT